MCFAIRLCPLFILAALVLPHHLEASVVAINNLPPGTQGFAASLTGPTAFGLEDRNVAFSFVTGPDAYRLDSLTFAVNVGNSDLSAIQADISTGSPVSGSQSAVTVGSVAPPSASPVGQVLSITASGGLFLAPSTTYWIHLTVPAGGAIYALRNSNNPPVFASGWSLGNTWTYEPDFGGLWSELVSGPIARIRLDVTVIPEPTVATLGLAAAGTFLRRRRRL